MSEFNVGDRVRDDDGDVGYVTKTPDMTDGELYWVRYDDDAYDREHGVPSGPADYLTLIHRAVPDPVNHPTHYTSDPSGVECIQVTRHRNFNIGNAMKYLWRAGLKDADAHTQDLRKAIFYIEDEIQRLENL